ncbi:hypothetical protein Q3G72_008455 [Acer saccharum]|nr:hypothetical protein Q3G72_008455 [Acer saccharum]
MACSYKIDANHRSDSPVRTDNNFTLVEEDSSSDDDEDRVNYKDVIRKGNSELESSILDPRDEATPDNWIKRNSTMVRLTANHPFNSEAPLPRLMHHGFITPIPLHYVRNHGPVPKASWNDWTIEITGLVKRPAQLTMYNLINSFKSKEFPVTLVCAGNRRKEQNMEKKTKGFNWGAAGVSTSVWRGVPLRDVLKSCGILSRKKKAFYVCFEGAEDLPGEPGGNGSKYGTSIKRDIAMDASRDIIIAYMQNGENLSPDHGFPVRMIIPGFIGGRMVKWLKRIIVTTEESKNYYHYKDNRVLPSQVDAKLADEKDWWIKPEYIINELNINSVITAPSHGEVLSINSWRTQKFYILKGYAYSGGGKKVTRVEVTMDGGETWYVCTLDHPEKCSKYGKYWCWCFWSVEVEVLDMIRAKEIAVRAWDETLNTQPEKLIWNVMGMMNNCWFRVKTKECELQGEIGILFEHPTQPGEQSGGWMEEKHLEKSSNSTPSMNTFSMSQVKKHNSADSAWIIVHGHIYDCTRFLKDHPGGTVSILNKAGTDCTKAFDAIHSDNAKEMLEKYRIGELITIGYNSDSTASSPNNSMHGVVQEFPDGGLVSQYLDSMSIDSSLDIEGPVGDIEYTGRGNFMVDRKSKFAKKLAMLAGGTGITPIYQVCQAILKDPEDETEMLIVYANRTEEDILLRKELHKWAREHDRMHVWYVVQDSKDGWQYSTGFVMEDIMKEHIPEGSNDTLALACGPNLEKRNYDINNSFLMF